MFLLFSRGGLRYKLQEGTKLINGEGLSIISCHTLVSELERLKEKKTVGRSFLCRGDLFEPRH